MRASMRAGLAGRHLRRGGLGAGAPPGPDWIYRLRGLSALPAPITFTRAGNASRFSGAGALEVLGADLARFDHNPATLALRGWLLEETRSNTLNTALTGGSAGVPGTQPTGWSISTTPAGMQRSLAYGTEDSMPYVEVRYWGTVPAGTTNVTAAFSGTGVSSAAAGQTWTQSFFARLVAGSWDNVLPSSAPLATNGTSGVQSFDEVIYPTSARLSAQRFLRTVTLTNASTTHFQPRFRFGLTAGTTVDFTVRIAWPQISQHAFSTSPIAGGATRPTETALISGGNFASLFDPATFAALIDVDLAGFVANAALLSFSDGGSNNRVQARISSAGSANFRVQDAGVSAADVVTPIPVPSTRRRMVLTGRAGDVRLFSNGVACGVSSALPAGLNQLRIMGGAASTDASGWVRELAGWRGRTLTSEQARRMSAVI